MKPTTNTKERPILFSAPMVRAILDGRKTQTRRIIKGADWKTVFYDDECDSWCGSNEDDFINDPHAKVIPMKYGQPGDRFWVRETFTLAEWYGDHYEPAGKPDQRQTLKVLYRATEDDSLDDIKEMKWKPSIFMPRWASRITLEIESVRVERLQDISEEDAIAEGIENLAYLHTPRIPHWKNYWFKTAHPKRGARITDEEHRILGFVSPVQSYLSLWSLINGPDSWNTNPWVWVIQFRRIQP